MFRSNEMKIATRLFLIAIVLLLSLISLPGRALPQQDDLSVALNKSIQDYDLGPLNFVEALMRVGADFHVPMGISWVKPSAPSAVQTFAWKKATVRGIIEDIAKSQNGYKVDAGAGIVHISPNLSISDRENFLKLRIDPFSVHAAYVEVASFKLHTLIAPRRYGQMSIGATGDSKVDIDLTNESVSDALDALALASNRKIWIVTFSDDNSLTANGFRRTISLWIDKPVPDEDQPLWQLMRWGDPIPPLLMSPKQ